MTATFGTVGTDEVSGVLAHALLNSMTVITGVVEVLGSQADLTDADRRRLSASAAAQCHHVSMVLLDVVRGLPPDARALLDSLSRR